MTYEIIGLRDSKLSPVFDIFKDLLQKIDNHGLHRSKL